MRSTLISILIICFCVGLIAQDAKPYSNIYVFSNLADLDDETPAFLQALQEQVESETEPTQILILGDLVDKDGLDSKKDGRNLKLLKEFHELDHVDLFITSGDRDWDNSGEKGFKQVLDLEDYIEDELKIKNRFFPEKACPGPEAIDINQHTRIIFFNSQWFIHPHDKAGASDSDCKILSENIYPIQFSSFWDELEEQIEEAEGRNVIVAAHHPVYSNTVVGGKKLAKYHLIPIMGTLYKSFRQNIGSPRELAYLPYHQFAQNMRETLANYKSVIYLSGHDRNMDIHLQGRNLYINSGSIGRQFATAKSDKSLFQSTTPGFLKLQLFENGDINTHIYSYEDNEIRKIEAETELLTSGCNEAVNDSLINSRLNPCFEEIEDTENWLETFVLYDDKGVGIANPYFEANGFRKMMMGEHYRDIWTKRIEVPYLDLSKKYGGLTPYATGGSGQTSSLRFHAGDGNEYYFRDVKKNEARSMSFIQLNSVYRFLNTELTSNSHPYASGIVATLLDSTDILHEDAELFLLPDDPALGPYQSEFGDHLGYLQQRVTVSKKTGQVFGDADDLYSMTKLYRKIFKDNKTVVDQQEYAMARLFDMWIGDWDRHEDNWKWAVFKDDEIKRIRPIPKDRDHAFSKYQGLIPSIIDLVMQGHEEFGHKISNLQHLNFKARHLDRLFTNGVDRSQWIEAGKKLESLMTNGLIDKALATLPPELDKVETASIREKLISRRSQLPEVAGRYHDHISKQVDIIGSNKREIIDVERLPNGNVKVIVFDRKKNGGRGFLNMQRIFDRNITKEIRIYSLGAKDEINITGSAPKSIVVRIMGGRGKDKITDTSSVPGSYHMTRIYDSQGKDKVEGDDEFIRIKPLKRIDYNPRTFEYNAMIPFAGFRLSGSNGFGLEAQLNRTTQGFNKPLYKTRQGLKYVYYPGIGSHRVDLKYRYRHWFRFADLQIRARYGHLYDKFPHFFGIGNGSFYDDDLVDEKFNRVDYDIVRAEINLERPFWFKSHYYGGIGYEYHRTGPLDEDFSVFNLSSSENLDGLGKENIGFVHGGIFFDLRDRGFLPESGSELEFKQVMGIRFSQDGEFFGTTDIHFRHYETLKAGIPITLMLGTGGTFSYGKSPFYYLAALGSDNYLRGSSRKRYLGDHMTYLNSELRFKLGTWYTPLIPFYYGFYVFDDIGRVFDGDTPFTSGDWHNTYGAGIFLTPVIGVINLNILVANSPDKDLYVDLNFSFDF